MNEIDDATGAAPTPVPPTGDSVAATVQQVRDDLAARRAAGAVPHLPVGELDRQFSAVIEAVDAGIVEEPPLALGVLPGTAHLETWRPTTGGLKGLLVGRLLHVWSRLVGAVVRRQVEPFAQRSTEAIGALMHRQNKIQTFLTRAHLDHLRSLEYRVAELERELDEVRADRTGTAATDAP
ncbi:hypothetical protein KSP35_08605 [Aquihabitans sp. G128]|uniref:hypothetical protein n=1 Tax=Aquihabitans sp. G128 TaxID=2849779 RepID=UPI001C23C403|nr:hypothetical protein [Aquihabitans sp. G128]QXC62822.1 hypothetical protein KSP35_08605 [Aquihabitans sp. G128]